MTDRFENLAALPAAAPDPVIRERIERRTQAWRYNALRSYAQEVEKRDGHVKHPSTLLMHELGEMRRLAEAVAPHADPAAIHEVRAAIGNVQRAAFHQGMFLDGALEVSTKAKKQPRMWSVSLREISSQARVDARVTQVMVALGKLEGVLERLADEHITDAKSRVMTATIQRHVGTVGDIVNHSQYSMRAFAKRDAASR